MQSQDHALHYSALRGKNQEGKTNLDLLEHETVSGSIICWAIWQICTSSQTDNHANNTSHH